MWETGVDGIVSKYPFIARGVGIDKVRLSFGNARSECENRVLGGLVSLDMFLTGCVLQAKSKRKQRNCVLKLNARKKKRKRVATKITLFGLN